MANKLFFESFDHPYWSHDKLWTSTGALSGSGPAAGSGVGRNGKGLYFPGSGYGRWVARYFDTVVEKQVLGFAYLYPVYASIVIGSWETLCQFQSDDFVEKVSFSLLAFPAGSGYGLGLRMYQSATGITDPSVMVGGTPTPVLANSVSIFTKDTFYYVEVDLRFGADGTGYCAVYVDGTLEIELSNLVCTNSSVGGRGWKGFLLGGWNSATADGVTVTRARQDGFWDDVYCHYGDSPTLLGDLTVGHKDLANMGLSSAWTAYPPGSALTNLTDNDAATGISSSVVNDKHNFTIDALGVTPETIHGVQVCAIGQKTNSGARSLALTALSRSYTGVLSGTPANTNTVTIGTAGAEKVYTFKTALTSSTAANEVLLGGDAEESMNNLAAAILGGDGAGTLYGSDTVAHTKISATVVTTGPLALTVTGNAGEDLNTQATTATGAVSWAAATLDENLDEDVSSDLPMSASAKNFIHTFTVDPRTNLAWTEDWVDAAYIGVKCR